jgi:hypothetical protein
VVVVRTPTVPTNARIAIKAIMAIKIMPFSSQPGIPACHRSGRVPAGKSVDIVPNVFDYRLEFISDLPIRNGNEGKIMEAAQQGH